MLNIMPAECIQAYCRESLIIIKDLQMPMHANSAKLESYEQIGFLSQIRALNKVESKPNARVTADWPLRMNHVAVLSLVHGHVDAK